MEPVSNLRFVSKDYSLAEAETNLVMFVPGPLKLSFGKNAHPFQVESKVTVFSWGEEHGVQ